MSRSRHTRFYVTGLNQLNDFDFAGKRKGSFAVYLEPWHADVFDFLELKKNHGKEEQRPAVILVLHKIRFRRFELEWAKGFKEGCFRQAFKKLFHSVPQ